MDRKRLVATASTSYSPRRSTWRLRLVVIVEPAASWQLVIPWRSPRGLGPAGLRLIEASNLPIDRSLLAGEWADLLVLTDGLEVTDWLASRWAR